MEITEEELEKIINERVKEKEKENEENIKRAIELYNLALKHRNFIENFSSLDEAHRIKLSASMEYFKLSEGCTNKYCYKMCQTFMDCYVDIEELIDIKMEILESKKKEILDLENRKKRNTIKDSTIELENLLYKLHYIYLSNQIRLKKDNESYVKELIKERLSLKDNLKNESYKNKLLEKYKDKLNFIKD